MKSSDSRTRPFPAPWLRVEILSTKIMNRTGEKEQPCWSPTYTRNRSDLLPAMQTRLLLRSYRDRTALSRGPLTPYSRSTSHRMPGGTQPNAFSKSTKHMWTGWTNSPAESIELVQCSTARTKNALFLLDRRFDYHLNSPLPSSSNRLSQGG